MPPILVAKAVKFVSSRPVQSTNWVPGQPGTKQWDSVSNKQKVGSSLSPIISPPRDLKTFLLVADKFKEWKQGTFKVVLQVFWLVLMPASWKPSSPESIPTAAQTERLSEAEETAHLLLTWPSFLPELICPVAATDSFADIKTSISRLPSRAVALQEPSRFSAPNSKCSGSQPCGPSTIVLTSEKQLL